jgi:hypothetical protein
MQQGVSTNSYNLMQQYIYNIYILITFLKYEAYNALGLAFSKGRRFVTRTLKYVFLGAPNFLWLGLLCLSWLPFVLTRPLKLHQSYSVRHTYCMHVHKMNIMYA